MLDREQWRRRAADLTVGDCAFIDGELVAAASGETFETRNPATGALLANVAACDAPDVDRAVGAARRVFETGAWSAMAPRERKRRLLRLAGLVDAHRETLALLETLDVGKPICDSYHIDIPNSATAIAWFAEAIDKVYGEIAPTGTDALATVTREPVGVVGAVVPWNFPLMMAAWKVAPALAAGNSVVLKPAEQSPLTAIFFASLVAEADIPPGVFNVLPGYGHTAGRAIGLHPDVDCVAFTGSTAVGKRFLEYSGQSNMKRVWLECGGKTPNIVFADCTDLDAAAEAAAFAIVFNQGEMCTAGSRLLVEASIKDELLERVAAAMERLQPGDPLDPASPLGAIIDRQQFESILGYVDKGQAEGAVLRTGGRQVMADSGGHFIAPTLFDGVREDMTIAREEIFGPVLSAITFEDEHDAVRIANHSMYGLAAALWTRDISRAHRVSRALRAGTVWVNCFDEHDIATPFGGYKQSGIGRDRSLHAFDKFVETKTTWIALGQ